MTCKHVSPSAFAPAANRRAPLIVTLKLSATAELKVRIDLRWSRTELRP
jgi:hypothetical protein